jgi:hypothetical protein
MAIGAFILMAMIGYCCWFFGRLHEAQTDARVEQLQQDAYLWAADNDKLPPPVIQTVYVDTETGEMLHGYNG